MTARLTQEYVEAGSQPDEYYRRLTQEYVEVGAQPDQYYRKLTQIYVEVGVLPQPEVTTEPATEVTSVAANLNGDLLSLGESASVDVYFQFKPQGTEDWIATTPAEKTEIGAFSETVTELEPLVTYDVRAAVDWGGETAYGEMGEFETEEEVLPGILVSGIQYDVPDVDSESFILSFRCLHSPVLPISPRYFFIEALDLSGEKVGRIRIYKRGSYGHVTVEIFDHSTMYTVIDQTFLLSGPQGYIDPDLWLPGALAVDGSNLSVQFGYKMIAEGVSPVEDPFDGVARLRAGMVDCGAEGDFAVWLDDIRWDVYSSVVFKLLFEGAHEAESWVESARNYAITSTDNCQIDGVEKDGSLQCLRMGILAGVLGFVQYDDIFLIKPSKMSLIFGFKYEGGNWTAGESDSFLAVLGIQAGRFSGIVYPGTLRLSLSAVEEGSPAVAIPVFKLSIVDPTTGTETIVYSSSGVNVPAKDIWHHVKIQVDDGMLYFVVDEMELGKASFGSALSGLPFSSVTIGAETGWSGITKCWISNVKVENDGVYEVPSKEFVAWDFDPCTPLLGYTKIQTEIFS
jgi:hypothetical protein